MAAIVQFIGSRVATIDSADAATNVSAVKMAGGGGSPATTISDVSIQGGQAVAMTYPTANRFCTLTYDIVTAGGTALNFNTGGANNGQLLYVWANALFPMVSTGNIQDNAYGGLGITISDNATITNSWANFTFYGVENYPGGWVRLCIDPTLTPTSSGGTFTSTSLSSIRKVGIFFVAASNAKSDAIALDAIDVGSGIRIYGSGTPNDGFQDLLDYDSVNSNNRYGVIRPLESSNTIINLLGTLEIGDPTGTNITYFDDINKTIVTEVPTYFRISPNRFISSVPNKFLKIKCVGNATSGTFITFGEKVGIGDTARGRNGLTFLGNSDPSNGIDTAFEFNDGNVNSLNLYGTTLRSFTPTGNIGLVWNATSNHEFIGSTIDNCDTLIPDSGVTIRNSTFLNSPIDVGRAALEFKTQPPNTSITNIKNCLFIANDYAINHYFTGTYTYDNLLFSDNTKDVYFSNSDGPIDTGTLTINLTNGSNASTFEVSDINDNVEFLNAVTLTLTNIASGSEVRIIPTGIPSITLFSEESVIDGTSEYTYNFPPTYPNVDIYIMNVPNFKWYSQSNFSLGSTSQSLFISQIPERNYENP